MYNIRQIEQNKQARKQKEKGLKQEKRYYNTVFFFLHDYLNRL